jgi:hypothetical protein
MKSVVAFGCDAIGVDVDIVKANGAFGATGHFRG